MLLDDETATLLVTEAAEHLCVADVPGEIADALGLGALTALVKDNGRIRGIVTGDTFRRGVARTMAQQCAKKFEEACMPFQYALSTRAGTDCVARVVRSMMELDPTKTLVSIDGIGAFDHIKRKSMLEALHNNADLAPLLPFVRMFYGKDSTYVWYDDEGVPHEILQGEGGEQGDPLMPALYALGQHEALSQVHATLRQGELLFAYLDDIYVLCDPSRVAEIFLQVKLSLFRSAGIQVNLGKTKIWNSAGIKPEDLDTVGAEAWTGEGPEEDRGLVVLGVPVGHRAFVQKWLADKGQSHAQFLSRIPVVQDAQSAWLLLLMCAGPRAHHILRNLPPSEVTQFCEDHDNRLRECLSHILSVEVPDGVASEVVQLPFREGGLGLRSAARLAPAAYWASWADCLSQVYARAPHVCAQLLEELEGPPSRAQCVREAQDAATLLASEGMEVPVWSRFPVADFRAPQPVDPEVGEWTHGWQFHASVARDTLFATSVHLPPLSTDHRALRASQRGPCASRHFSCLPTCPETTFSAEEFRTLLLVRLHLPLHLDARFCKCGELLDVYGHHRSACSRVGLLKPRGTPAEVCMARICREAGARVKENQLLRDLNIVAQADDQRRIEVIANGLPFWGGKQVAIDTTVVSALTGRGVARGRRQGQAIHEAEQDKRRRYPELLTGTRCHFLVMAFEVAGRWSPSAVTFLRNLAWYKSLSVPRVLRRSTQLLFFQRWTALLACSIQRAYAASLLGKPLGTCACVNGPAVHVGDLDRLPCA